MPQFNASPSYSWKWVNCFKLFFPTFFFAPPSNQSPEKKLYQYYKLTFKWIKFLSGWNNKKNYRNWRKSFISKCSQCEKLFDICLRFNKCFTLLGKQRLVKKKVQRIRDNKLCLVGNLLHFESKHNSRRGVKVKPTTRQRGGRDTERVI